MILSAFFFNPQGDHRISWRHPDAPGNEVFGLDYYRRLAEVAEQAAIDAIFVADHVSIWDQFDSAVAHYANARLEPLTLLSALAAVTRDVGLIATASTSYTEPYNLARMVASLDHLSGGRAAWNIVTSAMVEEARNYGRDANIDHALRYDRADAFVEIVTALWDSWEDGAVLGDRASGRYADPARVHPIDHDGPHFRVRGPLNVPRPPQGHPVLVQAGSSEAGRDFAARHADLHFAIARSKEEGVRYRADMDRRLARAGRRPESFKILPGILPIVAGSAAEAQAKREAMDALMPERVGVDLLSSWCGVDLSAFPLDGPLPALPEEASYDGGRTALGRVKSWARENLTIRQIARRVANTGTTPMVAGTASEIADTLQDWVAGGAADGFNLMFPLLPEDWVRFCEAVVPELRRRGLVSGEYRPGTLRDRLGLARPANRFAADKRAAAE